MVDREASPGPVVSQVQKPSSVLFQYRQYHAVIRQTWMTGEEIGKDGGLAD
jgi:hypothetical protein